MSEMPRYEPLTCLCGGRTFFPVFELRRHRSGGLVRHQVAEHCQDCGAVADVQRMTDRLTRDRRKREMAALEAEVAELEGTSAAPAAPAPAVDPGRRPL
jgi:hypothetical protein